MNKNEGGKRDLIAFRKVYFQEENSPNTLIVLNSALYEGLQIEK